MAQIQSGYSGGTSRTTTTVEPFRPQLGGGNPDTEVIGKLFARRIAQRDAELGTVAPPKAAPGVLGRPTETAVQASGFQQRMAPQQQQAPPPMQQEQPEPYYVKMLNIPGSMPGYVPAQPWEPGAVVGGYMPAGRKAPAPQQAQFGGGPGVSGASLSQSTLPSYGGGESGATAGRAIDQPQTTRTGAGIYETGNRYATGAGVVGGRYVDNETVNPPKKKG